MLLTFNLLLEGAGISPCDVRLMRHQHVARDGLTPYVLWRDSPAEFERYQSAQRTDRRAYFTGQYWASFVVPPDNSTLFVGLYRIAGFSPVEPDWIDPLMRATATQMGRELDIYQYERLPEFDNLIGRLRVDWGKGARTWAQRADSHSGNKPIVELLKVFREPEFPGFTSFVGNLGSLPSLPSSWATALSAARGIYLLTCPPHGSNMSARLVALTAFGAVGRTTLQQVMAGMLDSRAATPQIIRSAFLKSQVQPRRLMTFSRWSDSGRSNCKVWKWASIGISSGPN